MNRFFRKEKNMFSGAFYPSDMIKKNGKKTRKRLFTAFLVLMGAELSSQYYKTELQFYFTKTKENLDIINNVQTLKQKVYKPTLYLQTALLQIIYGAKIETQPYCLFDRELFELKDGGRMVLDWMAMESSSKDTEDRRILVLMPGMTGSSRSNYIRHMAIKAQLFGFRPVVVHNRGLMKSGVPINTPTYHGCDSFDDFEQAINYIQSKYPTAKLYGVGYSMGANFMTNYAALQGEKSKLKAIVSLANPFEINDCAKQLKDKYSNVIYCANVTKELLEGMEFNKSMLEKHNPEKGIDFEAAKKSKNSIDYDENVTIKLLGYKSTEEYYRHGSCAYRINDIKTPMLFINALDDPVSHKDLIPFNTIKQNENCILVTTNKGGHCDWFTTRGAKRWVNEPTLQYLNYIDKKNQMQANQK